jgi:hypothetical protein
MSLILQPLFLLIFIPLLGVFVILFTNNNFLKRGLKKSNFSDSFLYNIALFFSLLNLLISIIMWYYFNANQSKYYIAALNNLGDNSFKFIPTFDYSTNFQFIFELNQFSFGVDGISIFFVLLTTFITPIAIFSSYELYSSYNNINDEIENKEQRNTIKIKIFLISLLLLESLQICAFVSLDLLLFYVFFESVKWIGISFICLQLSNSGNTLKFVIPNFYWKIISGWTNYSGKVINQNLNENETGYRGSNPKFNKFKISVKEQRVNGNYIRSILNPKLKYTLMGCESNYHSNIHSKQNLNRNIRQFSTNSICRCSNSFKNINLIQNQNKELNPWFVTGFIDGEGCFGLYIYKKAALKIGWNVFLDFKITLHEKDKILLDLINNYFSAGSVFKHSLTTKQYGMKSIKDLHLIINHFDKYPLRTKKINDYNLFKLAYNLIVNKEHLTKKGLDKLIVIKSMMNKVLPSELSLANPLLKNENLINSNNDMSNEVELLNPYWFYGFTSAEGSFQIFIIKSKTTKIGFQVLLRFSVGQQARYENLVKSFIDFMGCGIVQNKFNKKYNSDFFEFKVDKFADIDTKIIPFFSNYPIVGIKYLDFLDFCKVAKLMKEKSHLTLEGLNEKSHAEK